MIASELGDFQDRTISGEVAIQGQSLSMCTEPLGTYFSMAAKRPIFADTCTALWLGYVGR